MSSKLSKTSNSGLPKSSIHYWDDVYDHDIHMKHSQAKHDFYSADAYNSPDREMYRQKYIAACREAVKATELRLVQDPEFNNGAPTRKVQYGRLITYYADEQECGNVVVDARL
jgi:hypothetical protein